MDVRVLFFALLLGLLGVLSFLMLLPFFQWVLAAGLLAFLLYPVHVRLRPEIGEKASGLALTGVAFLVAIVPLFVISVLILQSVIDLIDDFDEETVVQAVDAAREILAALGLSEGAIEDLERTLLEEVEGIVQASLETVLQEVVGLVDLTIHVSLGVMILAFLLYYFLVDGEDFLAWIRDVSPMEDEVVSELFEEIQRVTWAVIGSHILVAVVEGILGGIGLWLVGIPNVAFWTAVMIVVSILPVIGVWLVWAPAVGYLVFTGDIFGAAVLLIYGLAVLSVVDNYLRAYLVDKGSGLNPAVVLIGVLGGIYVLGILGLFLGPVVLAVFKASLDVFSRTYAEHGISPPEAR